VQIAKRYYKKIPNAGKEQIYNLFRRWVELNLGSITNEIKLMKEVSEWLKNWAAKVPPVNNVPGFLSHRSNLVEIKRKIDKILLHLRFNRPDVANVVEEKWKDLVNLALADLPNSNDLNESTILAAIGSASLFANTLHDIAKTARKERRRRIVKLIFYVTSAVVGFLAALLTIFYYSGCLEPIKAFIVKILWPK